MSIGAQRERPPVAEPNDSRPLIRKASLRSLHEKLMSVDGETEQVIRFITGACARSGKRILDVGCGHGRFLMPLHTAGFEVTGVDANPDTVATNRKRNLRCIGVDEFATSR